MSDLVEDPGGYNLRARYKWRLFGGMAAALTINGALIMGLNGKLARLLGFDADVTLRNSDVNPLVLAGFVLIAFVWAISPVVVYYGILALVLRAKGVLPPDAGWAILLTSYRYPSHWLLTEAERQSQAVWSACGFYRLGPGRQLILIAGSLLAIFAMLPVWQAIDAAFMMPPKLDRHLSLWSQGDELLVLAVWFVMVVASFLLALWIVLVIMAGVSVALGQLTPAEALLLIRRGRYPRAWARPKYRAGSGTFSNE